MTRWSEIGFQIIPRLRTKKHSQPRPQRRCWCRGLFSEGRPGLVADWISQAAANRGALTASGHAGLCKAGSAGSQRPEPAVCRVPPGLTPCCGQDHSHLQGLSQQPSSRHAGHAFRNYEGSLSMQGQRCVSDLNGLGTLTDPLDENN